MVADGVADRLGQCGRGHECRHQHDVFDLAGGQSLVQTGGIDRISPGDARRRQRVAGLGSALAGAQDRRDHLVGRAQRCRIVVGGDVELVVLNGDAVGVFAFDEQHSDRCGRHRHPEHDIHRASKSHA